MSKNYETAPEANIPVDAPSAAVVPSEGILITDPLEAALQEVRLFPSAYEQDEPTLQLITDAARRFVASTQPEAIDAAVEIVNELRYIRHEDEWDDSIYDITERAVRVALGRAVQC